MHSNSPATKRSTKTRTRCSWSAEERAEWLTMLEQSGQSLSEFCRANELPEATVSRWRKQLREPKATPTDAGALLEVPVAALTESLPPCGASNVTGTVVIRLPREITLEVTPGTDVAWLGELIRTLRSA
jgi:transposase-like protein